MASLLPFFALIFLCPEVVSPAKILVYNPLFAQSHVNFMSAIGRILTEEGHQVTVLSPVPDPNIRFDPSKFTATTLVPMPEEVVEGFKTAMEGWDCWSYDSYDFLKSNKIFAKHSKIMANSCRYLLNRTDVIEDLRAEKFDVAISEYLDACGLGIFHLLGLKKTILATSTHFFEFQLDDFGIPKSSSFVPALDSEISAEDLATSMWARAKNTYLSIGSGINYRLSVNEVEKLFKELHPDFPTFKELAAQTSLILTNSNPLLDFPRPTLQKVVDIGGLHVEASKTKTVAKNLSEEWNEIFNRREQTVLVSFGSIAKSVSMPAKAKNAIVEMARRIPGVTFVWKYEEPEDAVGRGVENLVKVAWTPQHELLQSGRLTAFLTHGGMGSTNEGVNSGVPLLLIGLFADQMRNAAMTAAHGGAIALDKWRLDDADYLESAMRKILQDPSYAKNARRLAAQLKARPFSARELLVRHTAFVAEHGPLHQMTPVSTKMNVLQRHLVDVFATITIIIVGLVFSLFSFSRWLFGTIKHLKSD